MIGVILSGEEAAFLSLWFLVLKKGYIFVRTEISINSSLRQQANVSRLYTFHRLRYRSGYSILEDFTSRCDLRVRDRQGRIDPLRCAAYCTSCNGQLPRDAKISCEEGSNNARCRRP